ncbi:protein phosphatase 1 regulatory subunit 21 isoform X2 [Strongylocentrotus purpuratus]|uniref:Protein phosphatase 1 regulatory subunit 21 n=1 Tax=Strongylocentrotus purpuratus TaxID=7668 RepID=A0A7M7PSB5_STRPU|nr:protein phosphatase 1 regulatory subunit 21 isoform X2 [Strongylocentrotus purpuratus]
MSDLQTKYQKLAQEFAKVRAQNQVLKKAVIEEQAKQNDAKEQLKVRDQKIRKFEQELDSLTFRNQQLTKRVNFLQDELDIHESKGGKKSKNKDMDNATHVKTSPNVIGEELRGKIHENETLHKQLYDLSEEHRKIVTELSSKLANLERDSSQHHSVIEASEKQFKETLERLQQERARMEVQLQARDKEVRESLGRAEQCSEELRRTKEELGSKLSWATRIIQDKLPFNDEELPELSRLNVPAHDKKHQHRSMEVMGQASTLVKELCAGLSNFHTYTEQRSKIFPIDSGTGMPISQVNQKFCSHLHENASYLRPLEQSFAAFNESTRDDALTTLETATGLQDVAAKFSKYVAYLQKLLPYQLLSIEEECHLSTCSQTLESRNMELHASLQRMSSVFTTVESYVSLLASASTTSCECPQANFKTIYEKLAESFTNLYEVMKDLSKNYNFKVSLEHQLPIASQKLKTTDECVVSSLISLVTCTGKISNFMKTNLDFFTRPVGYGNSMGSSVGGQSTSPCVPLLRQRAVAFMAALTKPCPETVPYSTAVQNQRILLSSTESKEGLAQQVASSSSRIARLEQEKEHWVLEAQLMQIKYDREMQKSAELESVLKGQGGVTIKQSPSQDKIPPSTPASKHDDIAQDTSMLGTADKLAMDFGGSDETSRENMIKSHYTSRLLELRTHQQICDSKGVNFSAEVCH